MDKRKPVIIPESALVQQNWQKPLLFDWEGKNGPPFTEEDLQNSELQQMIEGDLNAPWESEDDEDDIEIQKLIDTQEMGPGCVGKLFLRVKEMEERRVLQNLDPGKTKQKLYPRLSTLTKPQHLSGLKVLSEHYGVQPYPSPTPEDFQSFEEMKKLYEKEQEEYREWARNCWINADSIRTLHLNPIVETVYEAQFLLKKNEIQSLLHNNFIRGGYISLEPRMYTFEFTPIEDLKSVDVQLLQSISYPDNLEQSNRRMHTYYEVPKPCPKHPCKFILPHENHVTALSLPKIHLQLSQFAMINGAQFIASENALQCLLDIERGWKLPMTVAEIMCPDGAGEKTVVVVGSSFELQKACGAQRTYNSFGHLLRAKFTINTEDSRKASRSSPNEEELSMNNDCDLRKVDEQRLRSTKSRERPIEDDSDGDSPNESDVSNCSSERNQLVIDDEVSVPVKRDNYQTKAGLSRKQNFSEYFGTDSEEEPSSEKSFSEAEEQNRNNFAGGHTDKEKAQTSNQIPSESATLPTSIENSSSKDSDDKNCTCVMSGEPSPRSFKKWQVTNAASKRSHKIIIHSSHKFREGEREVILEPIVEWQPELGACEQSAGRLRALALALMMRPNAELMNVRMDYEDGNIIAIDKLDEEKFMKRHGDKRSDIADTIHKTIEQLVCLMPGQYILAHDSDKGPHVMVYSTQEENEGAAGSSDHTLLLTMEENMPDAEESPLSKILPTLSLAVLPYHTEQGILPLAFTTDKRRVVNKKKEEKKVTAAGAQASQAVKKRKKSRRGKKRHYPISTPEL